MIVERLLVGEQETLADSLWDRRKSAAVSTGHSRASSGFEFQH